MTPEPQHNGVESSPQNVIYTNQADAYKTPQLIRQNTIFAPHKNPSRQHFDLHSVKMVLDYSE